MLVVTKGRYKTRYVVGGAGIFDSIAGIFKRMVSSNVAKQAASSLLNAGKSAATEIGKKAIDAGKDVAIVVGKHGFDKVMEKLSKPKQQPVPKSQPVQLTQKSKDTLARLLAEDDNREEVETNINNLISGSGAKGAKAVKIQDLVRRLRNGAGMKIV